MKEKGFLFVFVDGVGLGADAPEHNPFSSTPLVALRNASPLDARLGVEGLPQSGTGQASLFTGINCARLAGRHYGPYPHSKTRAAIRESNIFSSVLSLGGSVAFANAYPPVFFELARRTDRWTVTTRCCLDAGVPIRPSSAINEGKAISADITGAGLVRRDPDVIVQSEEASARSLAMIASGHSFTLFEYFLTDKAGHRQDMAYAKTVLASLDRFMLALSASLDYEKTTLLITSDHGNLEDLSTRSHTMNPVPLAVRGWASKSFERAETLTDVVPAILSAFG